MGERFDKLSEEQKTLVLKHLSLVMDANKSINLTRIETPDDGMLLHIEDSLAALPEMESAPAGLYGDLGSGAGYPGIPLAIATGRTTVLVDARAKKMSVVQEIIENLGIAAQVSVFPGRAELLARKRKGEFAVLTARALARLSVIMELASPLLERGGQLICFKAHVDDEELSEAKKVERLVGMKLVSDRSFMLGDYSRRIMVFEKVGNPQVKLPRKEGEAQKSPLGK